MYKNLFLHPEIHKKHVFYSVTSLLSARTYTLCEPCPTVFKYPFSTSKLRSFNALFFKSPVIPL